MVHGKFVTLEEEYERNKELKKEDVQAILEWTKKQAHLPKITELQVARFLHSCFYSSEQAKLTIENFFTVRTHCPELFANRCKETLKNHTNITLFSFLPGTLPSGNKILYSKLIDPNPEVWEYNCMNMLLNILTTLGPAQFGGVQGVALCIDAAGYTFSHILKTNLPVLRKQLFYLQDAVPMRVAEVHCFNALSVVDKALSIIKPFLHGRIVENIFVHSKMEDLFKRVPQKFLPSDYGGTAPSTADLRAEMETNVFNNMEFIKAEEQQLVDESKRLGKSKCLEVIGSGLDGTFKKLNID